MSASVPREAERLAALDEFDLDGTRPEPALDAVVSLAASISGFANAAIAIACENTLLAKALHGHGALIAPRRHSFADRVIESGRPIVIRNALDDPGALKNMYVTGSAKLRAYAGFPIMVDIAGERMAIGLLCVHDPEPRTLDPGVLDRLAELTLVAEALIASRRSVRAAQNAARTADAASRSLQRQDRTFRQAERMARVGSWRYKLDDARLEWSDEVYRIHGLEPGALPELNRALDFYPPHARAVASQAIADAIGHGIAFDIETDFITAKGEHRRVRSMGELERDEGRPVAIIGTVQDVTERHRLEQSLRTSANVDEVTGIANRASFNRTLESSMIRAGEQCSALMLALIDLDDFKAVNDTYGHLAGDEVLRAIGARLRQPWLSGSFAARLGGDEFALIVENPVLAADPAAFARRLSTALAAPAMISIGAIPVSGTVGTSVLSDDIEAMRDLMHAADSALYDGKRRRRGRAMLIDERRDLHRAGNR
ncbi:MAG: diguanylate cyclase [Sphingomonas sp.]